MDCKTEPGACRLIPGYRNKGHLLAKTNPIPERKDRSADLVLSSFGFTEEDLYNSYFACNPIGLGTTTVRNMLELLKKTYANHIGPGFKYPW